MNTLLKKCLATALMFGSRPSISAMTPASAAANNHLKGKNIVLVHGEFAVPWLSRPGSSVFNRSNDSPSRLI
jgi:hypothetical protein